MTPPRYPPPLRIDLGPSRRLVVALAVMHALAIAVSIIALARTELRLAASMVLALHGLYAIRRHALLQDGRSIVGLHFVRGGICIAYRRNGRTQHCRIGTSSYVTPFLVVLVLDPVDPGFSIPVVLLRDTVTRAAHRRLRVRLRWSGIDEDLHSDRSASL